MAGVNFRQSKFRYRNDNGVEASNGATFLYDLNANPFISHFKTFRVRFTIDSTGTGSSCTPTLYGSMNGGAYAVILSIASQGLYLATNVSGITEGSTSTTTNQLGGTGTFVLGKFIGTNGSGTINMTTSNQFTEVEFCLKISTSIATSGDTWDLRVYHGASPFGASTPYTAQPRITIYKNLII